MCPRGWPWGHLCDIHMGKNPHREIPFFILGAFLSGQRDIKGNVPLLRETRLRDREVLQSRRLIPRF